VALKDLSSRDAVLRALSEFDQLGRDAFLARYGFGFARSYELLHDDKRYDPKAIVGAAHGHQFLEHGPLLASEFSGGELAANRKLIELGFDVRRLPAELVGAGRNPPWTRDELILALDLYMQHRPAMPDKGSAEVAELSGLLNKLPATGSVADAMRYRNVNGVYMKLMNLRRFDPDYTAAGHVGLQRGGKTEEEVWQTFAGDYDRLHTTASAIRAALAQEAVAPAGEEQVDDVMEAPEGRILTYQHQRRERNRKLVEKRKAQALKQHGRLCCETCSFDFAVRYGERGQGFIESTTPGRFTCSSQAM
jgi:5-methylcytosine-specific restriction enzyme A